MEPKLIELEERKLVGIKINTSLSESNTTDLWKTFMNQIDQITDRKNKLYYSVQIYPKGINLDAFTPITVFEKWAAVEVNSFDSIPEGMDELTIDFGKYAVFRHKGIATDFFRTSQYIFGTWLPSSDYKLQDRPHFEIMGTDYNGPDDQDSEEDVYIPIR